MSLSPGTRLGSYEVLAALGAGGMGEVYRAKDTKLNRDVALKILPEAFTSDPDRLARFKREAQVLASLNHPNIAAIYGFEDSGSTHALVMELVEGEDLSAHISRGAISLSDALPIAKQIADALEAAHEQDIVHRDLKPANIKVRADGTVKVLDFGLAKAMDPADASSTAVMNSPTMTARATAMGMIMGTAAYMSPEQAAGKRVDKRSDLWSFGVVLLEMLTGKRTFDGETVSHVLASVLKDAPDLSALPADTPASIRKLLRRCIEKDRKRRLDSAADARLEIDDALSGASEAPVSSAPAQTAAFVPLWKRALPWAVASITTAALVSALVIWSPWRPGPVVTSVVGRFIYELPAEQAFTRTGRQHIAVSPDGTKIAYIANNQIYVRRLGELEAQPVRGTDIDPLDLTFSPDGQSLAFFVLGAIGSGRGTVRKIAIVGGAAVTVCTAGAPYGTRWQGDHILLSTGTSIMSVADASGTPETLVSVKADSGELLVQPQLVNDGRDLLYTVRPKGAFFNDAQIVVQALAGGERRVLVNGGTDGRLLSNGLLVYVRDSTLFGQAVKPGTLEVLGGPLPLVESVFADRLTSGAGKFAIADNGTLVFQPGSGAGLFDLVWVDRQGHEEPTGAPPLAYYHPRVSQDGTRIVVDTTDADNDVVLWDAVRKTLTKLTSGPDIDRDPVWTPDGQHVIFTSSPGGQPDLFRRAVDGTGTLERLTNSSANKAPYQVLPDGRVLASLADPVDAGRLMLVTPGDRTPPQLVLPTLAVGQRNAEISPDGRWIAYESPEGSTIDEVHVRPFPQTDRGHWQISSGGGRWPFWSRSGRELFFEIPGRKLVVVAVRSGPETTFAYDPPVPLLDGKKYLSVTLRPVDVSPDGKRFLMIRPTGASAGRATLVVVTNWFDELRAKLKGK